mmetsp:Transcript_31990/g.97624  ORF Transcript_31990/g.97624 Transcript_31990/m.97624 type:complete len:219 (-) Transcript_31990:310-966(-)
MPVIGISCAGPSGDVARSTICSYRELYYMIVHSGIVILMSIGSGVTKQMHKPEPKTRILTFVSTHDAYGLASYSVVKAMTTVRPPLPYTPDPMPTCLHSRLISSVNLVGSSVICVITARASAAASDLSGRCAFFAGFTRTSSPVMSPTQSPYRSSRSRSVDPSRPVCTSWVAAKSTFFRSSTWSRQALVMPVLIASSGGTDSTTESASFAWSERSSSA